MNMKLRYRLFLRRKSVYYAFDDTTKTFTSLKTKDKAEGNRLLMPKRSERFSGASPRKETVYAVHHSGRLENPPNQGISQTAARVQSQNGLSEACPARPLLGWQNANGMNDAQVAQRTVVGYFELFTTDLCNRCACANQ